MPRGSSGPSAAATASGAGAGADADAGAASAAASEAVVAGRGVLYISVAKFYFMLSGYAIQFLLPRALGSASLYGDYGLVKNIASWFNNVVVTGTIQSVSRFTTERIERSDAVKRAALRLQVLFGGSLAALLFLGAPLVGSFARDSHLVPYLRIASGIVLCYSFYAVFVGSVNGRREFSKQAGLDMTYSTIRPLLVVGLAWLGYAVGGALLGFLTAAAVILGIAVVIVGPGRAVAERYPARRIAAFMAPLLLYMLCLNLLLFVDQFLLKRVTSTSLVAAGTPAIEAASIASARVGHYEAVQTLARIPYQAILAVAFVLFPLISRSTFEERHQQTRQYVRTTSRYSLIFAAALAVAVAAIPAGVLRTIFPSG